jgi:hypothetical protein
MAAQGFPGLTFFGVFLLLLAFMAAHAAEPAFTPAGGTAYYVDGVAGRNGNTGLSPQAAWQDFSNINGRTLNADATSVARDYVADLAKVTGWTGMLKQLRLDLTGGEAATGTVRVDFIRMENSESAAK